MTIADTVPWEDDECDCEDCHFWRVMEPVFSKYRDTRERRDANATLKAVQLSPDLETCEALMRGERVPKSRLDPKWRRAYGL